MDALLPFHDQPDTPHQPELGITHLGRMTLPYRAGRRATTRRSRCNSGTEIGAQAHRWAAPGRGCYRPRQGQCVMPPIRYEIYVEGILDQRWSNWFGEMKITSQPGGETVIAGPVADQAALHGLLTKIRDLNLPLISLRRLPT
jgi:hypothetical protein